MLTIGVTGVGHIKLSVYDLCNFSVTLKPFFPKGIIKVKK
jgi:hypothetical protein